MKYHVTRAPGRRPKYKRVLQYMFVLNTKGNADNTVDKFKARLVVLGCRQTETIVDKTYFPVLGFTTIRLVLALAGKENIHVKQVGVKNSFLHGNLHEEL